MKLTEKQLVEVRDLALNEVMNKPKPRDMGDKVFIAQCWETGFMSVLKKAGYVCVKQSSQD